MLEQRLSIPLVSFAAVAYATRIMMAGGAFRGESWLLKVHYASTWAAGILILVFAAIVLKDCIKGYLASQRTVANQTEEEN